MRSLVLAVCLSLFSNFSISQTPEFEWVKGFGGMNEQTGFAITSDSDGNIYTTGRFAGTVDFDPGPGVYNLTASSEDVFVMKMDSSGTLIWARQFVGTISSIGNAIVVDHLGNVYTTGVFQGTVDFNPGSGTMIVTSYSSYTDIFISKLDANGNYLWCSRIGGTEADNSYSIALDNSGNVIIAGDFRLTVDFDPGAGVVSLSSNGFNDGFIIKLSSAGSFNWVKRVGGSQSEEAISVSVDPTDNIIATGYFSGTVDFDPGVGVYNLTSVSADIFIWKLGSAGNFKMAKQVGGPGFDRGQSIVANELSAIYLTGSFQLTVDFDPGIGVYNLTGFSDEVFVLKLDSAGNFIWAAAMGGNGGEAGRCIRLDGVGNVYTTGFFSGNADFDPGAGTAILSAAWGNQAFILKLDSSGAYSWAGQFQSASGNSMAWALTIDSAGAIFTTGGFGGTTDFDPGIGSSLITAVQYGDMFIHKMSQCTPPSNPINTTPTSNLTVCSGATTTLTASGSGTLGWYSSATGGTYLGGGNTFITPSLTGNAVYYVQDSTCAASASRTAVSVGVNNPSSSSLTQIACSSFTLNAQTYTVSGVYVQTIPNAVNCDSVITLNLTILSPSSFNQNITLCDGQNLNVGSNTYSVTGTYSDTLIAANGCDSVVTTNLTVNPPIDTTVTFSGFTLTSNAVGASYQWIDCSSGLAIVGETNQTFTASANGNYAVGILSNGCTDTSACQTVIGLGDNFQNAHTYFLYPNPNNGTFILQTTSVSDVVIYDALGRTVYVEKVQPNVSVQISLPDSGLYLVNMTDMDGVQAVQRVIVNN